MITSDLDAANKTITLKWTASVGVLSTYSVTVLDGNDTKSSVSVTAASADINFSEMKNGHRYNIQITAFSQLYDGDQTVPSDMYEGEIKTVVKRK